MKSKYYSLVIIIGIFSLLIGCIFVVVNWSFSEYAEKQIESKINQFQFHVKSIINESIKNKTSFTKTIVENENLIYAMENKDTEAIHSILHTNYNVFKKDFVLVTDETGNALIKPQFLNNLNDISLFSGVHSLLNKKNSSKQNYLIWPLINNNNSYLIFGAPVNNEQQVTGTLNIGYSATNLMNIEKLKNIQFAIINKREILHTSINLEQDSFDVFLDLHKPIFDAVNATSQPSDIFMTEMNGDEIYSKILTFGYGIPIHILISVSKSEEFVFLYELKEYLIYIFSFFGFAIIFSFIFLKNKNSKISDINEPKQSISQRVGKDVSEFEMKTRHEETTTVHMVKEKKATIMVSKIISKAQLDEEVMSKILSIYHNIQTELIELYDGKIENILNIKLVASFSGGIESIVKAVQCANDINRLIKNESKSTACEIAFGLNYGSIYYSRAEQKVLIGTTLEKAEAILQISKPGQILMQESQLREGDISIKDKAAKVWRFKNFKEDIRLVNLA